MTPAARELRVAVLGPVSITAAEGGAVVLTGLNARALVAALVLANGAAHGTESLTDDIWGDEPPQNPRGALQTLVSRVRAAAATELVRSGPSGYSLGVDADAIDLVRARRLRDEASALADGDPARLVLVEEALALWRGEPGADLAGTPIGDELAAMASGLRGDLEAARARSLVALGRPREAVAALTALASARPYDDAAHAELMTALAADGRAHDALAVFAGLRARLRDDLGASPGSEITALNALLLRGGTGATQARVRMGLRAAPNALIGRDADLAEVSALLAHSRLVTILGAGGLGKTRLAQALAAASEAPAVIVVPLASVRAADDVPLAIASALGIGEASPGGRLTDARPRPDLRARVVTMLAERPTLLVLDNCEQIVDGVAVWAADVLESVSTLRILATSRTPLAIAAEAVFPLAPLPSAPGSADHGPAVRLFVERARAARPGAALPLDVVARLCAHLDGLPLAIELAAARIRTMTPDQIESRLKDRFALLTTGDRAAPERHRTLEAVIEWSWDLLDTSARHAMARLAVLPAGFSAATAAAVLAEASVDDVLDRLVGQSLLVVTDDTSTGDVRFRMLETVREFGISRLSVEKHGEGGGEDAAWDAVAAWARSFAAQRATAMFDVPVFHDVRAEHDNLIAVLRRALDRGDDADAVLVFGVLAQTWIMRAAFAELLAFGPAVFDAALRVREQDVPPDALAVVLIMGSLTGIFGEQPRALRLLARLRILRRRHPELHPLPRTLADILSAATDETRALAEIERVRLSEDPAIAVVGETILAQFAENEGDQATARGAAERAWEYADAQGQPWLAAMSAMTVAQLASQSAQAEDAIAWLDRAAAGFAEFGAEEAMRQQSWIRAGNLVSLGRLDEARRLFAELAAMRELTEDGLELASIGWFGLAEVDRAAGRRADAAESYERALQWFSTNDQRNSPWFLIAVAGLVSATTFDASMPPERIAFWARRLRGRAAATRRVRPEFVDKPVLGTVFAGWSAWALSVPELRERGLQALALAGVFGARQDLPSLHLDEHFARAAQVVGADAVAAARAEASALSSENRLALADRLLTAPLRPR